MNKQELEDQFNTYRQQVTELEAKMVEGARLKEQLLGKMELLKELYQKLDQETAQTAPQETPEDPPASFDAPPVSDYPIQAFGEPTG